MISYLFQPRCLICQAEAANFFCDQCESEKLPHHCHSCTNKIAENSVYCERCQNTPLLDALFVERHFIGNNRKVVLAAKFHKNSAAIKVLQHWISSQKIEVPPDTVTIPLPISQWRLFQRGFNQTEFLAKAVSQRFNLKINNRLLQRHHREAQSTIKGVIARRENIKDVFYLTAIPPKAVLLVDDVITSGATILEAAKLLRSSGCEYIAAVAVAAT